MTNRKLTWHTRVLLSFFASAAIGSGLVGCEPTSAIIGGIAGTTAFLGMTPSNEIVQVYYLGVFDPQEQIPPTVYRVRVHGQASAMSFMRFGSAWVPANVVDSLGTSIKPGEKGFTIEKVKPEESLPTLPTGRKLMTFGPEGFREAPKDHRLVLVMGANPKSYFEAVESILGDVSIAASNQQNHELSRQLLEALLHLRYERDRLNDLEIDIAREFPSPGEVTK